MTLTGNHQSCEGPSSGPRRRGGTAASPSDARPRVQRCCRQRSGDEGKVRPEPPSEPPSQALTQALGSGSGGSRSWWTDQAPSCRFWVQFQFVPFKWDRFKCDTAYWFSGCINMGGWAPVWPQILSSDLFREAFEERRRSVSPQVLTVKGQLVKTVLSSTSHH